MSHGDLPMILLSLVTWLRHDDCVFLSLRLLVKIWCCTSAIFQTHSLNSIVTSVWTDLLNQLESMKITHPFATYLAPICSFLKEFTSNGKLGIFFAYHGLNQFSPDYLVLKTIYFGSIDLSWPLMYPWGDLSQFEPLRDFPPDGLNIEMIFPPWLTNHFMEFYSM